MFDSLDATLSGAIENAGSEKCGSGSYGTRLRGWKYKTSKCGQPKF